MLRSLEREKPRKEAGRMAESSVQPTIAGVLGALEKGVEASPAEKAGVGDECWRVWTAY